MDGCMLNGSARDFDTTSSGYAPKYVNALKAG
jgi:hypothetical protein